MNNFNSCLISKNIPCSIFDKITCSDTLSQCSSKGRFSLYEIIVSQLLVTDTNKFGCTITPNYNLDLATGESIASILIPRNQMLYSTSDNMNIGYSKMKSINLECATQAVINECLNVESD